ncbi:ABC transporter permease [Clostridium gasigenes]|uniref:ABC transporter permease n=1 Tax=Clostridium gasigenes TaxID=94869 RepID=UPI00162342EA|nr:ABC transporter permease [Clostridium gasigenes]MBB6625533.1 ABC transporter permease [Clostridium gasigenes]
MGIWIVVKNEFIRSLKYKKKLMLSIVVPVIAVLAAIIINSLMKPAINIGIIDNGNTYAYEKFQKNSKSINGLNINKADNSSINTDMILAKYAVVLEFGENNLIKVNCLDEEFKRNIESIVDRYQQTSELTGFQQILQKMQYESMTVAERSGGFILLTLIITSTLSACNLIRDKSEGTLRRYLVSPNKPSIYILGTFIYNFINTVIQIVISVFVVELLPLDLGISGLQLLCVGLVIALIATSISCFIVNICASELQAGILGSVIALIMALLGGAFLPLNKMPNILVYLSNATVTKWIINFIQELQQGILNMNSMIPLIILCSTSLIIIILSCQIGKRKFV